MNSIELLKIFRSVVDVDNVSENWLYKNKSWSGIIMYPNDLVVLSEKQLDAVKLVAEYFNETQFAVIDIEVEKDWLEDLRHVRYFQVKDSYKKFGDLHDALTDHVYMSVTGKWSVVSRHNLVSIIASDDVGLEYFKSVYSSWKEDFGNFSQDMLEEYTSFNIKAFDPRNKIIKNN